MVDPTVGLMGTWWVDLWDDLMVDVKAELSVH